MSTGATRPAGAEDDLVDLPTRVRGRLRRPRPRLRRATTARTRQPPFTLRRAAQNMVWIYAFGLVFLLFAIAALPEDDPSAGRAGLADRAGGRARRRLPGHGLDRPTARCGPAGSTSAPTSAVLVVSYPTWGWSLVGYGAYVAIMMATLLPWRQSRIAVVVLGLRARRHDPVRRRRDGHLHQRGRGRDGSGHRGRDRGGRGPGSAAAGRAAGQHPQCRRRARADRAGPARHPRSLLDRDLDQGRVWRPGWSTSTRRRPRRRSPRSSRCRGRPWPMSAPRRPGMHEVRLATEIASARSVLLAAGIESRMPSALPPLSDQASELLGYVVREAVTNVVRHSRPASAPSPSSRRPWRSATTAADCRPECGRAPDWSVCAAGWRRPAGPCRSVPAETGGHRRTGRAGGAGPGRETARPAPAVTAPRCPWSPRRDHRAARRRPGDDPAGVHARCSSWRPTSGSSGRPVTSPRRSARSTRPRPRSCCSTCRCRRRSDSGADGIDACAAIMAAHPETRVIILTTFGRPGYLRRAMEAGAVGYMVKDAPAEQLIEGIRRVHQGLRVVDPSLAAASLSIGASPLTAREMEVLAAASSGASTSAIAGRLFLSEGTVRNHLSSAMGKLGAGSRAEAVRIATENGWLGWAPPTRPSRVHRRCLGSDREPRWAAAVAAPGDGSRRRGCRARRGRGSRSAAAAPRARRLPGLSRRRGDHPRLLAPAPVRRRQPGHPRPGGRDQLGDRTDPAGTARAG